MAKVDRIGAVWRFFAHRMFFIDEGEDSQHIEVFRATTQIPHASSYTRINANEDIDLTGTIRNIVNSVFSIV